VKVNLLKEFWLTQEKHDKGKSNHEGVVSRSSKGKGVSSLYGGLERVAGSREDKIGLEEERSLKKGKGS